MILSFNLNHIEMIKKAHKENGNDVDVFFEVYGKVDHYNRSIEKYSIILKIKEVSEDDEIVSVKLGNAKEVSAIGKKIKEAAFSKEFRISDELKEKICSLSSASNMLGDMFVSPEMAKKLMKMAIEELALYNQKSNNEIIGDSNKNLKNAKFIMLNKNEYNDINPIGVGKNLERTDGLQYLYEEFKPDFNKIGMSFFALNMFSDWGYWEKSSILNKNHSYYQSSRMVDFFYIFKSNAEKNPDKKTVFEHIKRNVNDKDFVEKLSEAILIEYINVTHKYIEENKGKDNFSKNWTGIMCDTFAEVVINNKEVFFSTFYQSGFNKKIGDIFDFMESQNFTDDEKVRKLKSIFLYLEKNKFIETDNNTVEIDNLDLFATNKYLFKDFLVISTEQYLKMFPESFVNAGSIKGFNPFGKDTVISDNYKNDGIYSFQSFLMSSVEYLKDVIEVTSNIKVLEKSISEKSLILSLGSNENIDNEKLKPIIKNMIKKFLKYGNFAEYSTNHEFELNHVVLEQSNREKNQINNPIRNSVRKF